MKSERRRLMVEVMGTFNADKLKVTVGEREVTVLTFEEARELALLLTAMSKEEQ